VDIEFGKAMGPQKPHLGLMEQGDNVIMPEMSSIIDIADTHGYVSEKW
jgi:hypothetical protein